MAIYPEILAGYQAAVAILAGSGAVVKDPRVPTVISSDPIAMVAAGPAAYSVLVVPLQDGVNVCRFGRFGIGMTIRFVEYPCSHEESDFPERFASVLTEVVDAELRAAAKERADAIAKHGPGGIEAWDQIRRIG
jgi:hypothetical protein